MRKKFIGIITSASLLFVSLAAVPALGSSSQYYKNVTVVSNDEVVGDFYTNKDTVEEFLNENEIELNENQNVIYDEEKGLTHGSTIYIEEKINVEAHVDNEVVNVEMTKGDEVKDLIKYLSIQDGIDYYYIDGDSTDELVDGGQYNLLSRTEETFTTTEVAPFNVVYQDTTDLAEGVEQVVTEGVNGEKLSTVKVVYYGGEEYLRKVVSEEITVAPVDKVVKRGVAKTVSTPQGPLKYSKSYTMSASAYTAGPESTGKNPGDAGYGRTATGAIAQKGVVAVDPSVIPLGTKLYIPGYGIATAADTGGSIKGNKIDLCFNTLNEALNFGRRNVEVYVLQ